jgi:hypothetical protein
VKINYSVVMIVSAMSLLVGCSEQTITSEPNTSESPNESPSESEQGDPASAAVGDTLTLHGFDEKLVVEVTVLKVIDPAKPNNNFFPPQKGNRFVALQLRLENVGEANYSDSPSNGAFLIDTEGQQYNADITDPVGPALGSPKISPGDERLGYITFEVGKGVEPAMFQFTLDSGFANETGEWQL